MQRGHGLLQRPLRHLYAARRWMCRGLSRGRLGWRRRYWKGRRRRRDGKRRRRRIRFGRDRGLRLARRVHASVRLRAPRRLLHVRVGPEEQPWRHVQHRLPRGSLRLARNHLRGRRMRGGALCVVAQLQSHHRDLQDRAASLSRGLSPSDKRQLLRRELPPRGAVLRRRLMRRLHGRRSHVRHGPSLGRPVVPLRDRAVGLFGRAHLPVPRRVRRSVSVRGSREHQPDL
jgi:hypothetical protein